jgi:hypothetical protein
MYKNNITQTNTTVREPPKNVAWLNLPNALGLNS